MLLLIGELLRLGFVRGNEPCPFGLVDFAGGDLVAHFAPVPLHLGELLGKLRLDQSRLGVGGDRDAGPGSPAAKNGVGADPQGRQRQRPERPPPSGQRR